MDRRAFISGLVVLVAPLVAGAQAPAKIPRIGLLTPLSPSDTALWYQAFRLGIRDLGWIEGKNISIEYRYAEGKSDRIPDLAADLVRLKVDVIVTSATTDTLAAKDATAAIPIVMAGAGDPVATRLVRSLARPGGNITGLSRLTYELSGKRLELLKQMVPKLSRVAVLWNPQNQGSTLTWKETQLPARQLGVQLHSLEVRSANDLDQAFEDAKGVIGTSCTRKSRNPSQYRALRVMRRSTTRFGRFAVRLRSQSHEGKCEIREDR
jgi:putative ABC transport system substrate-binding protein